MPMTNNDQWTMAGGDYDPSPFSWANELSSANQPPLPPLPLHIMRGVLF
jgi:hypothetical protein